MANALGIDFGSSMIRISHPKKGIVVREPSVIAVERASGQVLALGAQAEKMLGRTPDSMEALYPVRAGAVSDYESYVRMLSAYVKKLCAHALRKPVLIFSVPAFLTQLQEHAILDAASQVGAKRACLAENVLAAAIGAGVDFSRPEGRMVVDIGGGRCDIGVLSLGTVVVSQSVPVGGASFDEALVRFMRSQKKLLIGMRMAEQIKLQVGGLRPRPEERSMSVQGRDLSGNFLGSCEITGAQCVRAFAEPGGRIVEGIRAVLERTPPELAADIAKTGVTLTGGASLLWGMDEFVSRGTGIKARLADDCAACTALGLKALAQGGRTDRKRLPN